LGFGQKPRDFVGFARKKGLGLWLDRGISIFCGDILLFWYMRGICLVKIEFIGYFKPNKFLISII
jgi:hypothetical protein